MLKHKYPSQCIRISIVVLLYFSTLNSGWSINPEKIRTFITSNNKELSIALEFVDENPKKAFDAIEMAIEHSVKEENLNDKMLAYILLGRVNLNMGHFEKAIQNADTAHTLAIKLSNYKILPQIVKLKVDVFGQLGRNNEALNSASTALHLAKKQKINQMQIELMLILGDLMGQQNQIDEQFKTKQNALLIAEREGNKHLKSECLHSIGSSYFRINQHKDALTWYDKARQLRNELNDTLGLIATLKNISLANRDLGKFDESNSSLMEALRLSSAIGSKMNMADIYNLLGSLALRAKKNFEAIDYYNQSLQIREKLGYLLSQASTLENISRVQKELNLFEEASKNLQKSIELRTELNDSRGLASAYNDMGNLYSEKGEFAVALKYYLSSLKIRQEVDLQSDIARSLTNIGITYRKLNSHRNALKYFGQALELISDKFDPAGKAYIYIHHGNTLRDMGNPTKALESFKKALELRERTDNPISISQTLRSIANAYSDLGLFSQSKNYLSKALELMVEINDEKGLADVKNELGNLALKMGDIDDALLYFQHAAMLYGKHFDLEKRGLCLRKIGEIQTKKGQYANALENLNIALSLGERTGNKKLFELTLLALYDFHLARGEYKEALQYFQKHIIVRDSLLAQHQQEAIWQASLDLELDKKAEEIKKIEGEVESLQIEAKLKSVELQQQKLIRNFFAIALLFIVVIAIGSVYGYLIIRKKNVWLNEANEKLAKSEADLKKIVQTKDKLFSIIAHDLRSPFTALVGLTEIISQNASQLEPKEVSEYGTLIHESSQKLLNLIENLLHWSRSQTGKIKIAPQNVQLVKLATEVIGILSLQAEVKGINICNQIDNSQVVVADYDTLSTVIRNLVSNAIKYTEKNGTITLSAKKQNSKTIININDNGIGISPENLGKLFKLEENFSTKGTNQEAGTGLGLIVCKEFVEKNGGEISVESNQGSGTTFTITLPSSS
jgi:signal transduction histidine kinase